MSEEEFLLLYGTCPDMESGKAIAQALVKEKLVACVNLLPGAVSVFQWQDDMCEESECIFLAKTTSKNWDAVAGLYTKLHPYDEPALVALDVARGLEGYLGWVSKVINSEIL